MSSRAIAIAALGLLLAAPARGQDLRELRARLARAEALRDSLRRLSADRTADATSRLQRGEAGPIVVFVPGEYAAGAAAAVARQVWEDYRAAGFFDSSRLAGFALVTGLHVTSIEGREVVEFGSPQTGLLRSFVDEAADNAVWTLSRAATDPSWGRWVEDHFEIRWDAPRMNRNVVQDLRLGRFERTRGCLAGDAQDCARYLGLDLSGSVRERYTPRDMRTIVEHRRPTGLDPIAELCVHGGVDDACYEAWPARYLVTPASAYARRSFLHFVRETKGAQAVARLLADTDGSWGSRVQRATGQAPAELAAAWRTWVFRTVEQNPVPVRPLEGASSLLIAAVLLGIATRRARWIT